MTLETEATRCPSCVNLHSGTAVIVTLLLLQVLYVVLWRDDVQEVPQYKQHSFHHDDNSHIIHHTNSTLLNVYLLPHGQLGNHMFQYAYGYALKHKASRNPVLSTTSQLQGTFTNLSLHFSTLTGQIAKKLHKIHEEKPASYVQHMLHGLPNETNIYACCNFESWRYFEGLENGLRREFSFQTKFKQAASDMVQRIRMKALERVREASENTSNITTSKDIVLVAIHVRRGDLLTSQWIQRGWRPAPTKYFQNAMEYFQEIYHHVHFMICSDSLQWCKKTFTMPHVSFCDGTSHVVDMAAMTMCDHMIMSVGTFGWWAGWLNGGIVVYYDKPARPGSGAFEAMTITDFYPPTWVPISG